ncbi:MAG: hypothetical protein M3R55_03120 [Acidobacteriota bacterium]|nr:hypothetical protein [Acidobacteriota bacterium]
MSQALDEIRRLYFETTKTSIGRDFEAAIDLLKTLGTAEERQKATVYMAGLAEMRKEWNAHKETGGGAPRRTGKPRQKPRP